MGALGSSSVTWGNMANFETDTKKLAPWCPGVILLYVIFANRRFHQSSLFAFHDQASDWKSPPNGPFSAPRPFEVQYWGGH
jgi:hypothetical protein